MVLTLTVSRERALASNDICVHLSIVVKVVGDGEQSDSGWEFGSECGSVGTLASLARQLNKLLQSVMVLLLPFVGQLSLLLRSRLGTQIARAFLAGQDHLDMYSLRFQAKIRWFSSKRAENGRDIFRELLLGRFGLQRVTKTAVMLRGPSSS